MSEPGAAIPHADENPPHSAQQGAMSLQWAEDPQAGQKPLQVAYPVTVNFFKSIL